VPKPVEFPLIFSSAFSEQAGAALNEAASGAFSLSRIIRSACDVWLGHHRALVAQGFSPLNATDYLLKQTEAKPAQQPAPPQPEPAFVPQPSPTQSPFAEQPPMRAANGR
jgi:hypothetical protein